jgi:hypothetical protein
LFWLNLPSAASIAKSFAMQLKISALTTLRQRGAVTGFTPLQFEKMLVLFTQSYLELFGQTVAQRQTDIEVTSSLTSEEELLLFT